MIFLKKKSLIKQKRKNETNTFIFISKTNASLKFELIKKNNELNNGHTIKKKWKRKKKCLKRNVQIPSNEFKIKVKTTSNSTFCFKKHKICFSHKLFKNIRFVFLLTYLSFKKIVQHYKISNCLFCYPFFLSFKGNITF